MLRAVAQRIRAAVAGAFNGFTDAQGNRLPVPYALGSGGYPVGIPSSGTIGANGALTLSTALASTFNEGIYLFFPAGAVFAGSAAGLYFCIMSSATVGVVFNNLYTSGNPMNPAVLVPVVDAGPGAYAQVLTQVTLRSLNLTGGSLGPNGTVRATIFWSYSNSANSKTLSHNLGAQLICSSSKTASNVDYWLSAFANRGRQDRNACSSTVCLPTLTIVGQLVRQLTVDTSVDQAITSSAQLASSADWIVCNTYTVEVIPS